MSPPSCLQSQRSTGYLPSPWICSLSLVHSNGMLLRGPHGSGLPIGKPSFCVQLARVLLRMRTVSPFQLQHRGGRSRNGTFSLLLDRSKPDVPTLAVDVRHDISLARRFCMRRELQNSCLPRPSAREGCLHPVHREPAPRSRLLPIYRGVGWSRPPIFPAPTGCGTRAGGIRDFYRSPTQSGSSPSYPIAEAWCRVRDHDVGLRPHTAGILQNISGIGV